MEQMASRDVYNQVTMLGSSGSVQERGTIEDSAYLKVAYEFIHVKMVDATYELLKGGGLAIEIGGAGYPIKSDKFIVFTSDVRPDPHLAIQAGAENLPFTDSSIDALLLKDSLHHVPDPIGFFREALRVLRPGGVVTCVEPYWGPFAQVLYRCFHPEPFDNTRDSWGFHATEPSDSNQAFLQILLRRDREIFLETFKHLAIIEHGPLLGPSYALSGGLAHRSFIPESFLLRLFQFELSTEWWQKYFALAFLVSFQKL